MTNRFDRLGKMNKPRSVADIKLPDIRKSFQIGWPHESCAAEGSPATLLSSARLNAPSRSPAWHAIAPSASHLTSLIGLAAVGIVWFADSAGNWQLLNLFETMHGMFSTGIRAVAIVIGLTLISLLSSHALYLLDLLGKFFSGAAVFGPLAFAQIADTGSGASKLPPADPPSPPQSEIQASVYMGGSIARPSDVVLKAPDDTDLTLKKVRWLNESLIDSPYYGARGTKWSQTNPSIGSMVEFTHCKATAREEVVEQSGKHKGKPLPPRGPFTDIFKKLEYTHGLNSVTMNAVYRFSRLHPRIRPYFGIGLGVMVPHVEAQRADTPRKDRLLEGQITGPVFQVLGGIEWHILASNRFTLFTEYKFAYSRNTARLRTGGDISVNFSISQFILGVSSYLWRAAPATAK